VSARFRHLAIAGVLAGVVCARVVGSPFDPVEETNAGITIHHYVCVTRPWWTCEYTWERLRRENMLTVYRITFPADPKCSKSARPEYFELFYDPKHDRVVKMLATGEPDPPPMNTKRPNQSLEPLSSLKRT
jgi:hypothetical protein